MSGIRVSGFCIPTVFGCSLYSGSLNTGLVRYSKTDFWRGPGTWIPNNLNTGLLQPDYIEKPNGPMLCDYRSGIGDKMTCPDRFSSHRGPFGQIVRISNYRTTLIPEVKKCGIRDNPDFECPVFESPLYSSDSKTGLVRISKTGF